MMNIVAIPYNNFKQKLQIMKDNAGIRFSDIGNVLVYEEYVIDEETASALCYRERCKQC